MHFCCQPHKVSWPSAHAPRNEICVQAHAVHHSGGFSAHGMVASSGLSTRACAHCVQPARGGASIVACAAGAEQKVQHDVRRCRHMGAHACTCCTGREEKHLPPDLGQPWLPLFRLWTSGSVDTGLRPSIDAAASCDCSKRPGLGIHSASKHSHGNMSTLMDLMCGDMDPGIPLLVLECCASICRVSSQERAAQALEDLQVVWGTCNGWSDWSTFWDRLWYALKQAHCKCNSSSVASGVVEGYLTKWKFWFLYNPLYFDVHTKRHGWSTCTCPPILMMYL